jgi:hypothetical protein
MVCPISLCSDGSFGQVPYFFTNYFFVAAVFGFFTLLLRPLLALLISMPAVLYAYLFIWRKDSSWKLPVVGTEVGEREKWIAVGIVFVLVFL